MTDPEVKDKPNAEAPKKLPFDEANPETWPKYVSTTGQPVLVALLNGHNASVGLKPTPLHPRFHRAAIVQGAVPEGMAESMKYEEAGEADVRKTREELIIKAMADMVTQAGDDPKVQAELFTNDGLPAVPNLSARLGFSITAAERDGAWKKYCNEFGED